MQELAGEMEQNEEESDKLTMVVGEEEWFWMLIVGFLGMQSSSERTIGMTALYCEEQRISSLRQFIESFSTLSKIPFSLRVVQNISAVEPISIPSASRVVLLTSVFDVWLKIASSSFDLFLFSFFPWSLVI